MGFGDKLKGLRDQAQQTVAENKDRIQGAVQVVGEAANSKTHGKYATKIAKVGERVSGNIDKFAGEGEQAAASEPGASAAAADAPAASEPEASAAAADAPAASEQPPAPSAPPEFE